MCGFFFLHDIVTTVLLDQLVCHCHIQPPTLAKIVITTLIPYNEGGIKLP